MRARSIWPDVLGQVFDLVSDCELIRAYRINRSAIESIVSINIFCCAKIGKEEDKVMGSWQPAVSSWQ